MKIYEELVARGLIAQVTDEAEIRDLINNGKATFYIGFDPTADSLHIGHYIPIMAMAHLQRFAEPSADTFSVIRSILPLCEAQINEPGLAGHGGMSLLGYTAAFHLMEQLEKHAAGRDACAGTLERLAGALRIWVGSAAGEKAGLEGKLRQRMIDRCLGVTKSIMGMETNDPGYVSMEDDCDEDGDGC